MDGYLGSLEYNNYKRLSHLLKGQHINIHLNFPSQMAMPSLMENIFSLEALNIGIIGLIWQNTE